MALKNKEVTIPVYTDCKTLVNRLQEKNVNNPTLVTADHMDIIYQIRTLIAKSNFHFDVTYTKFIKNDDFDEGTPDEKLVQRMHTIDTTTSRFPMPSYQKQF